MQSQTIGRKLLAWYRNQKRQLPWRGTSDPYRIWISEVMLQQTTVAAVRQRYSRFLVRFPHLSSLARASEDAVLAAWSGLGYYGRARNLRRAARRIFREHRGRFPRDPKILESLPGFGPYTAAAVASLAFGTRTPALDANVTRVVSRLFAIDKLPGARGSRELVLARAREILPKRRPGDATAALMDLGQTICRPRKPDCPCCPLRRECIAFSRGRPERYPRSIDKPRPVAIHLAAAFAESRGRAFLLRRRSSFLDGLWEFPSAEGKTLEGARTNLFAAIQPLGLKLSSAASLGATRHTIVNRRFSISVYPASLNSQITNRKSQIPSSRWFRPADLDRAAVPTLTRKIARVAGFLPRIPPPEVYPY